MKYRKFTGTDYEMSVFGIGTMRLPVINGDMAKIDEEQSIRMIRKGIDMGVNYVDTAYMYHEGNSEKLVGKALKDGYREKVFLADKIPVWSAKTPEDQQVLFDTQLERCDVDYFDLYLIHNIDEFIWKRVLKYNTYDFVKKMQKEGKVGKIGFSFHGKTPEFFKEVIDHYNWDFCQIQLNYMDIEEQAGVKGLEYAASRGVPVVVMEPLKGGMLTDSLPESVKEYWDQAKVKRTPAEWALNWVADRPEVMTILSGVSSYEQLEDNIRILSDAEPNTLSNEEHEIIRKVGEKYNELLLYPCTDCKYCMPCPHKVSIPDVISYRNDWDMFNHNPKIKDDYNMMIEKIRHASNCEECGECEEKCPQHLPIMKIMKESAEIFEK